MTETFYNAVYNPDVLTCLANLSNDEVFTPPEVANAMLDLLPQELFSDPNTTFLDPACKSGVFLREIAKRLLKGLEPVIPDLQQRVDHIFQRQLYGIAITELTGFLSRRSLYCSKFPASKYSVSQFPKSAAGAQGNIRFKALRHTWDGEKCVYCGASRKQFDRSNDLESHAYEFIHSLKPQDIWNMKFDVIISNPPYQISDGGSAGGALPIYQKFVSQAKKLHPKYLCMIIPSRWFAGGRGLEDFRSEMLKDKSITQIVDYPKSRDCFQGVDIAGGVCYFLRDENYNGICRFTSTTNQFTTTKERLLDEFPIFIRDNIGIGVVHKIVKKTKSFMSEIVEPVSPFGLRSFTRGHEIKSTRDVTLISSAGKSYIPRSDVKKGTEIIDKYKVVIGYLNPDRAGVNNASDGKSSVTTKISICKPGEVITETYIVLGAFETLKEAKNCASYIQTKFARFLIYLTLSSMHITKTSFMFVPLVRFDKEWKDDLLNRDFDLNEDEVDYISSVIRDVQIMPLEEA